MYLCRSDTCNALAEALQRSVDEVTKIRELTSRMLQADYHRNSNEDSSLHTRLDSVHFVSSARLNVCIRRYELNDQRFHTLESRRNDTVCILGTGCAVPSKYRNVSSECFRDCVRLNGMLMMLNGAGILVNISESNSSYLLDCGEGTWYQLMRMALNSSETVSPTDTSSTSGNSQITIASKLKMIWISHPHADHHLGLISVISQRYHLVSQQENGSARVFEPIIVIAPPSILCFLADCAAMEPRFRRWYVPISCRQLDPYDDCARGDIYWSSSYFPCAESNNNSEGSSAADSVWREDCARNWLIARRVIVDQMGIAEISNVKVHHCVQSYGVAITMKPAVAITQASVPPFKLVYSGDTRPCDRLVQLALADGVLPTLLIHEATFEDDKSEEAVTKRHSTISEALDVGSKMSAFRVLLTHFSQRYPGTPKLSQAENHDKSVEAVLLNKRNAIVAFDYMHLKCSDLLWAPATAPLLEILFPASKDDDGDDDELGDSNIDADTKKNKNKQSQKEQRNANKKPTKEKPAVGNNDTPAVNDVRVPGSSGTGVDLCSCCLSDICVVIAAKKKRLPSADVKTVKTGQVTATEMQTDENITDRDATDVGRMKRSRS
jgi:ribonuclease BN (tRNA processing enzyme)